MTRLLLTVCLAGLMACGPAVATSEEMKMSAGARVFGSFIPEQGAWSAYAIRDRATGEVRIMRFAIVGVAGDSYWLEVDSGEGRKTNIIRMLTRGDPYEPGNIQRLITKSGEQPARELGPDLLDRNRARAGSLFEQQSGIPTDPVLGLHHVRYGKGAVTVPAGTFEAEEYQIVDAAGRVYGRYQSAPGVFPFTIVASEAGNISVQLVGHGKGALSLITEEPVMVPPQDMGTGPGNTIRQIPGMGTGYESRQ